MSYRIVVTNKAERDIKKIDKVIKKRIRKKLLLLQDNPIAFSKKLINFDLGQYRLRVGDYRVIFDIDGKIVVILRVQHRREVYKN